MAQTISDFKDGFNGGTRANRFKVQINFPNLVNLDSEHSLQYHAVAAKLPSAELGTIKVPYRGRLAYYAGDRDYKPWTVTIIDDQGTNASWKAFHEWSDYLSSHDENLVVDPSFSAGGAAGNWLREITFTQLHSPETNETTEPGFQPLKVITLNHAWPSEVGEISLDMGEGGSLVSYNVTFVYDYYDITNYGG